MDLFFAAFMGVLIGFVLGQGIKIELAPPERNDG